MAELKSVKLPRAIWTPWADVLCAACNNKHDGTRGDAAHYIPPRSVAVPNDDDHVGTCDECGSAVADEDGSIIPLANVAKRFGMEMEQTGGMCSAAVRTLKDGRILVVTDWAGSDGWVACVYPVNAEEPGYWGGVEAIVTHEATDRAALIAWVEKFLASEV